MALSGLHTNWLAGSYAGDREYILRAEENADLFNGRNVAANLRAHFDQNNSLALGYGLDLLVNSDTTINSYLTAAGLGALALTSQDTTVLGQARAYRSSRLASGLLIEPQRMATYVSQLSIDLVTDANARGLLNAVANAYQTKLIEDLTDGGMSANDVNALLGTREFAALLSLKFNGLSPVVRDSNGNYLRNRKMLDAILQGNRAEAWFQIRYNSNGNDLAGLAKRRFFEADTFGLYSAGASRSTISDAEAKDVFRMYTAHRDVITAYEIKYAAQISKANLDYQLIADPVGTWAQDSQIAREYMIDHYAQFAGAPNIDGEVLVGSNIGNVDSVPGNDLLLGEARYNNLHGQGGNDILRGNIVGDDLFGDAGDDVLFGDGGDDTLQGGDDNDLLEGGQGKDRLVGGAGTDTLRGGTEADTLIGGTGENDLLEGGVGFDTYLYTTGDGHDRIEDSDANGVIIVNGKPLVGGVKKAGHTDWTSPDGTLKYIMSGTDLIVELNGTTIMTVNENFQSGQFGIRLMDGSGHVDGAWVMERSAA